MGLIGITSHNRQENIPWKMNFFPYGQSLKTVIKLNKLYYLKKLYVDRVKKVWRNFIDFS